MQNTKDYSVFKEITSNREVDSKHVKSLVKAIREKNLLYANPILVSEDMRVIDGQHRLAAAEEIGVEIYYIVANVERKDISRLNSHQKNWRLMDYVNFYAIEKVPEFVEFSRFAAHNPKFPVTGLLSLVNKSSSRGGMSLKNGDLNLEHKEKAIEIINICHFLNERYGYDFVYDATFPVALKKAMQHDGFSLVNLYDKISIAPRAFVPCRNKLEYLKMIEDVYNYKLSSNKVHIA